MELVTCLPPVGENGRQVTLVGSRALEIAQNAAEFVCLPFLLVSTAGCVTLQ